MDFSEENNTDENFLIRVSKKISAAHYIPGHKGKCSKLHGHTWKIEAVFLFNSQNSEINEQGIVYDFEQLKESLWAAIRNYDHSNLNDSLPLSVKPTAEHLARHIYRVLKCVPDYKDTLDFVTVWESDSASVSYYED